MSVFARMSTGILFVSGRQGAEYGGGDERVSAAGISFGAHLRPTSERLSDEGSVLQRFSFGMRSRGSPAPSADDYWKAPWRQKYAPKAVRERLQGPRVLWSKRVGM